MAGVRGNVRLGGANPVPPRGLGCIHSRVHFVQEFFDGSHAPIFGLMHTHTHGY